MDPVHALCGVMLLSSLISAGGFLLFREGLRQGAGQSAAVYNALEAGRGQSNPGHVVVEMTPGIRPEAEAEAEEG